MKHWPWFLALLPAILAAAWSWHAGQLEPKFVSRPSHSLILRDPSNRIYGFEERRFGQTLTMAPIPLDATADSQTQTPQVQMQMSGRYNYQTTLHFRTIRPTLQQVCHVILGEHRAYWTKTSVTLQGRAWPYVFLLLATPVLLLFLLRRPLGRVLRLPQPSPKPPPSGPSAR